MMYDWGSGYGWGWVGWLFMTLWWILIVIAIVLFVRYLARNAHGGSGAGKSEESAMEIIEKRYARGEIDKKEFDEKRKDLSK